MAEEQQTCQVEMFRGRACGRPLYDGEKCICHAEAPGKDSDQFIQETVRILGAAPGGYYDFTRFVFPDGWKPSRMDAKQAVYFDHARFLGEAAFGGFHFRQSVSFEHAVFKQDADFANTKFMTTVGFSHSVFHGAVDFGDAELHNPRFFEAVFAGAAVFIRAAFAGRAQFFRATFEDEADFLGVKFDGEAYFGGARFLRKGQPSSNEAKSEQSANFGEAKFAKWADFDDCRFGPQVRVVFHRAEFGSDASFHKTKFGGWIDARALALPEDTDFPSKEGVKAIDFSGCTFRGLTRFEGIHFQSEADFQHVIFDGQCEFLACKFAGPLSFQKAQFTAKARCRFDAEFFGEIERAPFAAEADFRYLELDGNARLTFRKVSLERCLFLETDVTKCEFVDVRWPRRSRLFRLWWKRAVADETSDLRLLLKWNPFGKRPLPAPEYYQMAQLYRDLQANLEQGYRYSEAGDFYVGEQEMIRKDKGWIRRFICMNWAYKLISLYGENFGLSLIWLVSLLLLFPVYLVFDGVFISGEYINYSWTRSFSDIVLFKVDYWNTVWTNFSVSTLNRGQIAQFLAEPYKRALLTAESFALAVLATFFIAALRRQFKRKTF